MRKSAQNAFTLIELLVVIAIMGMIGTYVLANYRSFGEDQNLKSAVLNVVSLLKQAQTNATTNVICNGIWQVNFASDQISINLQCGSTIIKTIQVNKSDPNIIIQSVSGVPPTSCPNFPGSDVLIKFNSPFSSISSPAPTTKIDLGDGCTSLTITLKNNKTQNTKSLTIEQGGRIYAQ